MGLVLEPLSDKDRPNYFLTSIERACRIIEELNDKRIGIMWDIYHMQRMQGNIIESIQTHAAAISHYQVADVPGRHEPGTGEISYQNVITSMVKSPLYL
jgi:hydroxypyruvate isomerase